MSKVSSLLKAETRGNDGATNVWLTPRWLLDALGPFDLDPASCPQWNTAKTHYFEADNGLYKDWDGLVWLNPPYGVNTGDWVSRWVTHGNGFLLVAARPDTGWFHEAAKGADVVHFPRGRIQFLQPGQEDSPKSPAFASVIFAAGDEARKRLKKLKGLFLVNEDVPRRQVKEK